MLQTFSRCWQRLPLALLFVLLLSNSAVFASEETTPDASGSSLLSLNSDVVLPIGLWPQVDNETAAEVPSMTLTPPPPLAPPPLKSLSLMLDWYLSPQHAALIIAKERELFAAQGLDVTLQTPADPSIALKLLTAGEIDLALTRQPLLHLFAHEGIPIIRIGSLFETPLNAVIVAGPASVDTQAQLADLHYGYTTREGSDFVAERLLPHSVRQIDEFIPPESIHFDAASAIREGRVDAVADGHYHYLPQQLAPDGITTHVVRYHDVGIPRHDGLILVANSDSVVRRAATWSRFMIAVEEASHWIIEHPDEAWTLLTTAHPVLDNATNAAAWEDLLRRMALSPAALDTRRYTLLEDFLVKAGIVETALPVERLAVDPHSL